MECLKNVSDRMCGMPQVKRSTEDNMHNIS